jgi:hypothetical protein
MQQTIPVKNDEPEPTVSSLQNDDRWVKVFKKFVPCQTDKCQRTDEGGVHWKFKLTRTYHCESCRKGISFSQDNKSRVFSEFRTSPTNLEVFTVRVMEKFRLSRVDVDNIMESLKREGSVFEPKPGMIAKL